VGADIILRKRLQQREEALRQLREQRCCALVHDYLLVNRTAAIVERRRYSAVRSSGLSVSKEILCG
jgi:hypothetical protein